MKVLLHFLKFTVQLSRRFTMKETFLNVPKLFKKYFFLLEGRSHKKIATGFLVVQGE